MEHNTSTGMVYLVGAGPGDPGLITVRGLDVIGRADVIIYDYLAAPALLRHARDTAELIYVGKKGGNHTLSQDKINDLIVEKARQGAKVARLKGGDPFIFGRGGEEAEALIAAGIAFEVVPGVTSAIAAPAYAGIPLTHRKYTTTVAFVTGHEDPGKEASSINWPALARGIGTLVFLMGVKNLPQIVASLIDHGKSADTPAALVRWGTTARQQTVAGTLATIVERVRQAGLKAPAIIVVGEVVRLRDKMQWFDNRPLLGKRIVVTRARAQASDLVRQLAELGAECLEYPTISVEPPLDWTPVDRAIDRIDGYDWLIFTSVNGVKSFFGRLFSRGRDIRALGHIGTAAIGPATAAGLLEFGLTSDIVPESYQAEAVIAAFEKIKVSGRKILLPRAAEARPILPQQLAKMGAVVDEVPVYRTLPAADGAKDLVVRLAAEEIDMITFTSSSTVTNFTSLLPRDRFEDLIRPVTIASIGPITTETAGKLGFKVHLTAESFTIPGLVAAIVRHYNKEKLET
ncbi:MAG: uroporphyrinogen-III C-methyltransferase [Desulfobacterales bacterium]